MRLSEKVIIVTGGTSGIGKAIVERAVAEGARVLVHGIERRDGEALVAQLGSKAALHLDDLVDPASPGRIAAAALAAFGRIDAVVNNAAIVARSNLLSTTPEFFDRMIAVNLRAALFLIQAALPQLKAHQGCVLNIGSINAHSGQANLLDEAAEKFAERTGGKKDEQASRRAPVILSAFSGGYRSVAFSLTRGGLGTRLKGVLLLDAIYGDIRLFSQWILERWHDGFFVSLYGPSTERWHEELKTALLQRHRRPSPRLPARIRQGTHSLISVQTEHNDLPLQGPPAKPLLVMLKRLNLTG